MTGAPSARARSPSLPGSPAARSTRTKIESRAVLSKSTASMLPRATSPAPASLLNRGTERRQWVTRLTTQQRGGDRPLSSLDPPEPRRYAPVGAESLPRDLNGGALAVSSSAQRKGTDCSDSSFFGAPCFLWPSSAHPSLRMEAARDSTLKVLLPLPLRPSPPRRSSRRPSTRRALASPGRWRFRAPREFTP